MQPETHRNLTLAERHRRTAAKLLMAWSCKRKKQRVANHINKACKLEAKIERSSS